MAAGLKKNGTRAFAVATWSARRSRRPRWWRREGRRRRDVTASGLAAGPHSARSRVIRAADGVLDAGAPGVAVEYRDARKPTLSWSVRRGTGDLAGGAPVPPDASFRIGSVTKTYLATAVLGAVGEGRLSLDDTLAIGCRASCRASTRSAITVRMLLDHTSGVPDPSPRLLAHPRPLRQGRGDAGRPRSPRPATWPRSPRPARSSPTATPTTGCWRWSSNGRPARPTPSRSRRGCCGRSASPTRSCRRTRRACRAPSCTATRCAPASRRWTSAPSTRAGGPPRAASSRPPADLDRFASALLGGRLLAPAELARMKRGVRVPANPMGVSVYGLGLTEIAPALRRHPLRQHGRPRRLHDLGAVDGGRQPHDRGRRQHRRAPRIDRSIRKVVEATFCG